MERYFHLDDGCSILVTTLVVCVCGGGAKLLLLLLATRLFQTDLWPNCRESAKSLNSQ